MRRPWKIVFSLLLILITIAVIAWVQLDAIAQNWLEQTASRALGVEVNIGRLDLRRFEGHVSIRDLSIQNPQGFTNSHLLEINQLDVTVQPGSLLSNTIQIPQFQSQGWVINVEQHLEKNNLQQIIKPPTSIPSSSGSGQKQGKTAHLQAISLDQIAVNFDLDLSPLGLPIPFLNQRKQWQYTLDSVRLENLNLGIENSEDFMRSLFSSTVFGALQNLNANPARSLMEKLFEGQLPFEVPPSETNPQDNSERQGNQI